ncbi:Metal-dependent phosphoesterase [Spironucleus salmonicida]|uniref:Metal-dependent phosphoesterase n=1 Tax=Spironucleus salmonicida TaxID=348837 RepID=V6LBY7_9EUKA|nr:Metal-dependent phosphoesterase [Spironucleus salmonicida]|eukprot:EST41733.1 Metal-dependent phosphoesterase [Spironucleus salmonicida]
MKLDLHCHSTCSDGVLSPQELYNQAVLLGLDYLSITDHDSLDSMEMVQQTGRTKFLPGVELSVVSKSSGRKHHLLGFFPRPSAQLAAFQVRLQELRKERIERAKAIVNLLNYHHDLALDFVQFAAFAHINLKNNTAESTIGRPHLADFLVSKGVVESRKQAFSLYLGDGSPSYLPSPVYYLEDAIHEVKGAGGYSFIAHIMLFGAVNLDDEIASAFAHGLDGLEVYHASNEGFFKDLAARTKYQSLGSDYHNHESKWELGCERGNSHMSEEAKSLLAQLFNLQ